MLEMEWLTGNGIDQNKSTMKHTTVERVIRERFPGIMCVNQLVTVPRCFRGRANSGENKPQAFGKEGLKENGEEMNRPKTTGMSDNGWHISPGDTEPKASRE